MTIPLNQLPPNARKRALAAAGEQAECRNVENKTTRRVGKATYRGAGLPVRCCSCTARWDPYSEVGTTRHADERGHYRFESEMA